MEHVLFVVNPRAASGRAARVWSSLCERVRSLRAARVVRCGETSAAASAIAAALTPRIRRVVAVGGDGTLHYTLNLLLADPDQGRHVGLVPVGTGSDLARGLGLERRPERALAQALEAAPARLDALRLTAGGQWRYFINEASIGLSARVAARVNAVVKRNTFTFLGAALRELVRYEPRWARIRLDGRLWWEGRYYLAVVANGSHFGKGMRIAPQADPSDGLADVIVAEAAPKAVTLAWLPSLYLGKHLAAPFVRFARARSVAIETGGEPAAFEGDGEVALSAPGEIAVMPGAVWFAGASR
ncbi:MAG TPA: diacylglycerol kinase family protein [Burkholderiales bacterium]